MLKKLRQRASVANILAGMALFVALGGTAWAIEKNSVQSKHIVNGEVRSKDLKDNGVKPKDVKIECAAGQTLIRGLCFDSASKGPAASVYVASDNCRADGGWLPDVLQIRSTRDVLNLGDGATSVYADVRFNNDDGSRGMSVSDNGGTSEINTSTDRRYICVYQPLD